MVFRSALILIPLAAFAQPKAPPEVDEALRARVTQFCQYHVEGNFRKAYDLVAEDTKDWYFAARKFKLTTFTIGAIKYNQTFDRADVQINTQRPWKMRSDLPETIVPVPVNTVWKIENGKWVYWQDPVISNTLQLPMGPSAAVATPGAPGAVTAPPKLPNLSPEALQNAAQAILKQASVDKKAVSFAPDRASTEVVHFHNSYPGPVQLYVDKGGKRPSLTIELDKTNLNAGEDATLSIKYTPPPDQNPTPQVTVTLFVQPFGTRFPISVSVTEPAVSKMTPLLLPMGPPTAITVSAPPKPPNPSPPVIPSDPKPVLASVDKKEVTFAADKASTEVVRFHNSYPQPVKLYLDEGGRRPSLTIRLDKISVNAGEDATLSIKYTPLTDKNPTPPVTMILYVQPFGTKFPISVKVEPAKRASSQ